MWNGDSVFIWFVQLRRTQTGSSREASTILFVSAFEGAADDTVNPPSIVSALQIKHEKLGSHS